MFQEDLVWIMGYACYDGESYILGVFESEDVAVHNMNQEEAEDIFGEGEFWVFPTIMNIRAGSEEDPLGDLEDRTFLYDEYDEDDPEMPRVARMKNTKFH